MAEFTSRFIRCGCHAEMLEVARWSDDPDTYLSFWYYGGTHDGKLGWRQRLRLCWKVLREGRGHPDHLVLSPDQAADLRAALGNAPTVTVTAPTTFTNGIANYSTTATNLS